MRILGKNDGHPHYYLEPGASSMMLHGDEIEEYIKNLRDAKDLAEFICENIDKQQKGEIA